jgi:hypothetical protein
MQVDGTGAAAARLPEVVRELSNLKDAQETLQGQLNALAERLSSILRPAEPKSEAEKKGEEPPATPLGQQIATARALTLNQQDQVVDLIARLEN